MKKLLSIDFDYFINATISRREYLFPNGSDEVELSELKAMWNECYELHEELRDIGVIYSYKYMCKFLDNNWVENVVADSHKEIKELLDLIPCDEELEVVNIDFHHDFYHFFTGGDEYNCGNWVRRLLEDRPDTKIVWVRQETSQIDSLEGEVPFEHTTDLKKAIEGQEFDYIFICKSPEWTPPHLDKKFDKLVNTLI